MEDKYLEELYKTLDYSSTEFDKSLTYISGGMLAVSFAFIEKIVVLKTAIFKGLLIQGWYILGVSIVLSVIAHFVNVIILHQMIKYYKDEKKTLKIQKVGNFVIQSLNALTLLLILIGSINIINFIKVNI